jgi:hypothetical protein
MYRETYRSLRERTKELFQDHPRIRCPYFGVDVVLNADGFYHLRYSARFSRNRC